MLTEELKRNKRNTYFQMKVASSSTQKDAIVQKLGGSIKASITKLKILKTDIMAENDIKKIQKKLSEFAKENQNFNGLQKSLAELDDESDILDRLKKLNKQFIETYHPEEIEGKLNHMKKQKSNYSSNAMEMGEFIRTEGNQSLLQADKHQLRAQMLKEELEEIKIIERLVSKTKQICTDCSQMIMDQGAKLQIAASNLKNAKEKLSKGKADIMEANTYQQDTNKKLFMFCLLIVIIVVIVLMIMFASNKDKTVDQ